MDEQSMKAASLPRRILGAVNRFAARWIALPLLTLYRRLLSPVFSYFGSECRFYPSCSHYAEEAYKVHGFVRGTVLTTVRVAKCNPLHPGGIDPVPGSKLEMEIQQQQDADTQHHNTTQHTNGSAHTRVAANHSG